MCVGSRVRELRNQRGWSQQQLADAGGLQRYQVLKIETGEHKANDEKIKALSRVFDIHPGELFGPLPYQEFVDIARTLSDEDRAAWLDMGKRLAGRGRCQN